jgi:DNA-binding MarR family transcriptional regulator
MPEQDRIDELVSQWARERPDLELEPMVTLGLLARLHANLLRAVEAVFSNHTLQVGEFDVLATLRRVGEPYAMKPTALARQLMLSPAGMTSRLDRLEARGLIERRPAPDDRRSTSVLLTKDGLAVIDAAVTDHVANEARLVSALSATEQRTLDRLLRKLLDQFEGRPPPPN